ncbi:MAG TPA: Na+ dependent nucleoside transporter [Bacteroidetes bacterium]|nr:Na+ dependent nucleoside transporter [Bacteroidota bacterium]
METILSILRGVLGMSVMLGFLYLLSYNRKAVNWKLVGSGLLLQIVFGFLVLRVDIITDAFGKIADFFVVLLGFTNAGTEFLLTPFGLDSIDGAFNNFVFSVLPTIVFFSALTSMLYYFGVLQMITKGIAWVMSKTMKLTGAESLAAAANVLIGQTEAPLVIKPYLEGMSRSEIMCLMVGGFATIAGSVFAAYINFLGGDDIVLQQKFARHLLTASIMSAPAAIVAAKILYPEDREISLEAQKLNVSKEKSGSNVLDAITLGATDGFRLAVNVGVMLLVFTAFVALINYILTEWVGSWTGLNDYVLTSTDGRFAGFNFQYILGQIFAPIAWLLGVPWEDSTLVGQLLGMKTAINEFYAYAQLPDLKDLMQEKSLIITTYALCGFANFASVGIQIGGIASLAPGQRTTLTQIAIKAMIGGTIAAFLTAIIAGVLI